MNACLSSLHDLGVIFPGVTTPEDTSMTNLPDCQDLQGRLRDYEDELHRLQSDMRDANNQQVRLERELPRERSRLLTLQAAEVALNGSQWSEQHFRLSVNSVPQV